MNTKFTISNFYCTKCGKKGMSLPRKIGKNREAGHLKKIYCINCKKDWNHVEVRDMTSDYNLEDFLLEMNYNNFDEQGNRKQPYRIFRGNLKQKGIITNGKTIFNIWDSRIGQINFS